MGRPFGGVGIWAHSVGVMGYRAVCAYHGRRIDLYIACLRALILYSVYIVEHAAVYSHACTMYIACMQLYVCSMIANSIIITIATAISPASDPLTWSRRGDLIGVSQTFPDL